MQLLSLITIIFGLQRFLSLRLRQRVRIWSRVILSESVVNVVDSVVRVVVTPAPSLRDVGLFG